MRERQRGGVVHEGLNRQWVCRLVLPGVRIPAEGGAGFAVLIWCEGNFGAISLCPPPPPTKKEAWGSRDLARMAMQVGPPAYKLPS